MSRPSTLQRAITIPDEFRVARSRRLPELGPKVLFFSGGSALRKIARALKSYTHNSIHLITPFDSGGSSARLREAFGMPSVGDLRNRLMALADETARGNPQIYALFSHRFPHDDDPLELGRRLQRMVEGSDPLVAAVPGPLRQLVRTHLRGFVAKMPPGFDLRGASIGNLVLAAGYLANERDIDSVLFMFSRLVEVRGIVRPVVTDDLHLQAQLEDGRVVTGQHLITGKTVKPLDSRITELRLVDSLDESPVPARASLPDDVSDLIAGADLICFPVGSFFSSIIACLLPDGVGRAVAKAGCPKVFIPNMGNDPEQVGMSVADSVRHLLDVMRRDAGSETPAEQLVQHVLLDEDFGQYPGGVDADAIEAAGVPVLTAGLVDPERPGKIDGHRLSAALVSMT